MKDMLISTDRQTDYNMNSKIVPTDKLWTKETVKRYTNHTHWAVLRTKKDPKTGQRYFDILVGLKGKAHMLILA